MLGVTVKHKAFGKGIVTEQSGKYITVSFSSGEKKFLLPGAFDGFLTTEDEGLNALARQMREAAAEKVEKAKEDAQIAEITVKAIEKPASAKPTAGKKKKRAAERSNVAFKCNFCDGGCSETCVGYKGVCSDRLIHYNIEVAKHTNCLSGPCKQYYDRRIGRKEIAYPCQESVMLIKWKAGVGYVLAGQDKGQPMKLKRVQQNSLAVLTTKMPGSREYERFIFAVFLVDENCEGDSKNEGYVSNHSKWRMELTPEEAHKTRFWDYYINANKPEMTVFNSGLHRYLSDMQAAQILKDIAAVKRNAEEKQFAQEFFAHFCRVVGLSTEEIEPPAGALRRKQ